MAARIDDPDLDVDENSVLVLQNAGPQGAPGMPEWGQLPIPKKLLERGRARHGPHLRRAHERHQLRCVRAARRARVVRRRAAGPGARRRRHRARRAGAQLTSTSATTSWTNAAPTGSHRRRSTAAATARCTWNTSPKPTRAATSTSWKPGRRPRSPKSTERPSLGRGGPRRSCLQRRPQDGHPPRPRPRIPVVDDRGGPLTWAPSVSPLRRRWCGSWRTSTASGTGWSSG